MQTEHIEPVTKWKRNVKERSSNRLLPAMAVCAAFACKAIGPEEMCVCVCVRLCALMSAGLFCTMLIADSCIYYTQHTVEFNAHADVGRPTHRSNRFRIREIYFCSVCTRNMHAMPCHGLIIMSSLADDWLYRAGHALALVQSKLLDGFACSFACLSLELHSGFFYRLHSFELIRVTAHIHPHSIDLKEAHRLTHP